MSEDVGTLRVFIWLLEQALSTWETHFLQLEKKKKIQAALPTKVIGKLPLDLGWGWGPEGAVLEKGHTNGLWKRQESHKQFLVIYFNCSISSALRTITARKMHQPKAQEHILDPQLHSPFS